MAFTVSTSKSPGVSITVYDDTAATASSVLLPRPGSVIAVLPPSPPPAPQPITHIDIEINNAPGMIGFGTMLVRMGIGLEFANPDITNISMRVNNAPAFANPDITNISMRVDNAPGFYNPDITNISMRVDNAPGFYNPDITNIPVTLSSV